MSDLDPVYQVKPDPSHPLQWAVVNESRKELLASGLSYDAAKALADALNAAIQPEERR